LSVISERQKAVVETIRMQLSAEKSLLYMKDAGYDISISTYKRDKNKLNKNKLKRLYHIAKIGFEDQHLERIDTLELIQKEMWKNYHECNNPFQKVMILEKIVNVQPYLSSYYESTKEVIGNSNPTEQEDNSISDTSE